MDTQTDIERRPETGRRLERRCEENKARLLELQKKLQPGQRILLFFERPTRMSITYRRNTEVEILSIAGVFEAGGDICYTTKSNNRKGFPFGRRLELVNKIELSGSHRGRFKDYLEFRKKFDPRFISYTFVKRLWEEGHTSYGRPWEKRDFRSLTKRGREVMNKFLERFQDINTKTFHYAPTEYSPQGYLEAYHLTRRRSGRDIKICHSLGSDRVYYSSEYQGCGNGDYYIVANKNEVLFLDRD